MATSCYFTLPLFRDVMSAISLCRVLINVLRVPAFCILHVLKSAYSKRNGQLRRDNKNVPIATLWGQAIGREQGLIFMKFLQAWTCL